MYTYIDSSVACRIIFKEKGYLATFSEWKSPVASALMPTECYRTIDRLRALNIISVDESLQRHAKMTEFLASFSYIEITQAILQRAAEPQAIPLGTLDAIHLATALLLRESEDRDITIATHDRTLAEAARLHGFVIIGVAL